MSNSRLAYVLVVVAAIACGGDDAASTTEPAVPTTTEATTTTTAPSPADQTVVAGAGSGTEMCDALQADLELSEGTDIFDPAALEISFRRSLAAIEAFEGQVPDALEEPLALILDANRDWIELLEEQGWDVTEIPEGDPRAERMASPEVAAAGQAFVSYCDLQIPGQESTAPLTPDDVADLMPPAAGQVLAEAPILVVETTASFDQLVKHYEQFFGRDPVDEGEQDGLRSATFLGRYDGRQVAVFIQETASGIQVSISG